MAWYLNSGETPFKSVQEPAAAPPAKPAVAVVAPVAPASSTPMESSPPVQPPQPAVSAPLPAHPAPAVKSSEARAPEKTEPIPVKRPAPVSPRVAAPVATQTPPPVEKKPPVKYTFYGILPGDKPAKPVDPPASRDIWWLQIAALGDARKADQIKARLLQLNLRATTQKIDSNGQPLYRIRVGPYKREDDAYGDLDILTEHELNARLLKESLPTQQEKP